MMVVAPQLVLGVIVLTAAGWDLAERRIPNPLVLCGLLLGLGMSAAEAGGSGLLASVLGIVLAFAINYPQWMLKWMGGGDAKLFMVVGAFLGPLATLDVILWSTAAHGIVALATAGLMTAQRYLGISLLKQVSVPMALGIFLGTVLALRFPLMGG